MVDNCRHVNRITPSADHSILNPQKWLCCICGTTESVWACLSCSHVACGRYIEEHALKHYEETKHPISLEVNDKYAYCYECGDYILNDNAAGDLKILRNALSAVALQSFDGLEKRGRRILRSQSFCSLDTGCERRLREQDRNTTILWFRRYYLIAKMFNAWKQSTSKIRKKLEKQQAKLKTQQEKANAKQLELHGAGGDTYHPASSVRKGPFIPGVTGLRNLGNTCYMNSVLQVLRHLLSCSHMRKFRQIFLESPDNEALAPSVSPTTTANSVAVKNHSNNSHRKSSKYFVRQTTMECFQHVSESGMKRTGLNGGASTTAKKLKLSTSQVPSPDLNTVSLCRELHALLRVMWSGKWALVSPHKMLSAVWKTIPFFKGYSQQDAQEFLCEFLDKLSSELEKNHMYSLSTSLSVTPSLPASPLPTHSPHTPPNLATKMRDIVTNMFHGELVSELTCTKCGTKSLRTEPFTDLSLEFPDRYHYRGPGQKISYENVHVEEMLRKFTEKERLEGKVYSCEKCNNHRRRSVAKKPTVYTQVEKQFMVQTLPHVLRLHLKRFMWGGRNHRGKISVHVDFSTELDMRRYCHETTQAASFLYNLNAVVMHHGRGFGSGHYTSYCWNEDADSWIHCNDAKLEKISVNDVMKVQAYILFYTQKTSAPLLQELSVKELPLFDEKADDDVTFNYQNSAIPKYVELKRRLSEDHSGRMALKKRRTTSW